jgi:DNA invertase Pin-like site-specific DNA recombinase
MIYGYARCSTSEQENSIKTQTEALKAAGCTVVRSEMVSGASREGRRELQTLMEFMREGDVLIVTKLDRLARSTVDMLNIVGELGERGVGFKSLAESAIDTTTPAGRLMLAVMASIAQFERERLKERQREGIDRVKRDREVSDKTGRYKYAGPPQKYDPAQIREMRASGMGPAAIARALGCSQMTVFRSLKGNGHA